MTKTLCDYCQKGVETYPFGRLCALPNVGLKMCIEFTEKKKEAKNE